MSGPRLDIYLTPLCPEGCSGESCDGGRHEYSAEYWANNQIAFLLLVSRLRKSENDPPLVFLTAAGVALMVNSEHRSAGPVPLNWFEECSTCGAGSEGCPCEPNILAILAKEGGSEWQ